MKNKILKLIFVLFVVIIVNIIFSISAKAATLSISTSKSSVSPGETFNVIVSLNGGAGPISASTSNGSGTNSGWLENNSFSFSCKAGNSGNVTINAFGTVGDFDSEKDVNVTKSATVKILEKQTESTSANTKKASSGAITVIKNTSSNTEKLKKEEEPKQEETRYLLESLKINDGNIPLEFKTEIFEYEIKIIGKDISKLNVDAKANTDNAIINIYGNEEIVLGENTIIIELKGQDDKEVTNYTLKVIKEKSEIDIANETIINLKQQLNILGIVVIALAIIIVILIILIVINKIKKKEE